MHFWHKTGSVIEGNQIDRGLQALDIYNRYFTVRFKTGVQTNGCLDKTRISNGVQTSRRLENRCFEIGVQTRQGCENRCSNKQLFKIGVGHRAGWTGSSNADIFQVIRLKVQVWAEWVNHGCGLSKFSYVFLKQVLYIGVPSRKVSDLGGPKILF